MELKFITGKDCLLKGITGVFLFILGLFILIMDPLGYIVKKKMQMSKGSLMESMWMDIPVEVDNYIYVYNITNSEEFMSGRDAKLKLQEIGPYVYKEVRGNKNFTYHDNGTLTYIPTLSVPHSPELSVGDVYNDTLVTLNLPMLALLSMSADSSSLKKFGLNLMLKSFGASPFVTVSVHDYFWGYEDKMISALSTYLPGWIDFNKFGVLDRLYVPKTDIVTVNLDESRGVPYTIEYWNGSPGLKQWGFEDVNTSLPCNNIHGSFEGFIYPPNFKPENNTFRVYKKMFCRALSVNYLETVNDESGLVGHSYSVPPEEMSCKNPSNVCFCPEDKYYPDGVADISPCYYGMPVVVSNPHFYGGDPKLLEPYEGLKPDKEKHMSSYILQPDMGLPIKASVKAQLSIVMNDVTYNRVAKPLSDKIIPLVWIDSKMGKLPDHLLLLVKLSCLYLPVAQLILGWVLLLLGIGVFFYNSMGLVKPTQQWMERNSPVTYPGRLPIINNNDKRKIENKEESTVFI